jgi:hypothetical protein
MKLLIIATALIMPGSAPVVPAQQAAPDRALPSVPAPAQPGMREMPNAFDQPAGCMPIVQQVQEQAKRSRENEFRTLDREPPANLLLAVARSPSCAATWRPKPRHSYSPDADAQARGLRRTKVGHSPRATLKEARSPSRR